ncbi:MAG: endopeptidase La, partial [Burkholderiaceae bacterium]
ARQERRVGIVLQRKPETEQPGADDLYEVGTEASILRYLTTPDGTHHVVARGERRFRILELLPGYGHLVARVEYLEAPIGEDDSTDQADERSSAAAKTRETEIEARMLQLKERVTEVLQLLPQAPAELAATAQAISRPGQLCDFVSGLMDLEPPTKQHLLETVDLKQRIDAVLGHLAHRINVLKLSNEIGQQTGQRMNERQREMLLREQLQTIQKELGESGGNEAEIAQLREAIEDAGMPEPVLAHARKELKRLSQMPDQAAEYSSLRTYLDWLTELPWRSPPPAPIDLKRAREILDEDHFGLEKIKKRILEYLAVRKLNPAGKSPILCFAGPPGVGKTSLGQSIARATGRAFARVSLGGVHDEAEIRGHRRTYVGALPGNILQAVKKAGTNHAVVLLDEIDKMGAGFHGDPAAAMLEVLDPEQNSTFRDNYLAQPYDLSRILFIATANTLDGVPGPLRDRMEIIQLPGYTLEEKLQIARRYLVPRQREANGVPESAATISDEAIETLIADYTREAGVRSLEREIGSILRHVAMRVAGGEDGDGAAAADSGADGDDTAGARSDGGATAAITIDSAAVERILGPRRFESEIALRTGLAGVATGLAWTPVGGDILFIEASPSPGSGRLILTGQLGDVMKESAQAALTLVKTHAQSMGVDREALLKSDVHVHVPAGAIPKDGPSAGVAMFTALASMALERPVRSDLAMTGEISLRGLVLPVGGIREKVLAALRAGIHTVMLPARNRRDLDDIPATAREQLEIIWLETVDDALGVAFEPIAGQVDAPEGSAERSAEDGAFANGATTTDRSPSPDAAEQAESGGQTPGSGPAAHRAVVPSSPPRRRMDSPNGR